jgi:hypothetical protein
VFALSVCIARQQNSQNGDNADDHKASHAPQVNEDDGSRGGSNVGGPLRAHGWSGTLPRFQGLWNFSKNKSAAKSLMAYVSTRSAAEKLVDACQGYDLLPFVKFNDIKTSDEQAPPRAPSRTIRSRGDRPMRAGAAGYRRANL